MVLLDLHDGLTTQPAPFLPERLGPSSIFFEAVLGLTNIEQAPGVILTPTLSYPIDIIRGIGRRHNFRDFVSDARAIPLVVHPDCRFLSNHLRKPSTRYAGDQAMSLSNASKAPVDDDDGKSAKQIDDQRDRLGKNLLSIGDAVIVTDAPGTSSSSTPRPNP